MKLLIVFLLTSVLGLEVAHASRPSPFVDQAVQRMALQQTGTWRGIPYYTVSYFDHGGELEKSLGIAWDWDRSADNLFATFEPDKLEELSTTYVTEDIVEVVGDDIVTRSKKTRLYSSMLSGNTKIAAKMVEMGLDLNEVDLQGLLIYALSSDKTSKSRSLSPPQGNPRPCAVGGIAVFVDTTSSLCHHILMVAKPPPVVARHEGTPNGRETVVLLMMQSQLNPSL